MNEKSFSRRRHLTFPRVGLLILQRTLRSVHAHMDDFFRQLNPASTPTLTGSAWTQARAKLKHTAFIELNEKAILAHIYRPENEPVLLSWRGLRVLGIDSSIVRLPARKELAQEFGWVESCNQTGATGRCVQAGLSVLYDVRNRLACHTLFESLRRGERQLAYEHLPHVKAKDVVVLDRGYPSFELFARFIQAHRHFVCRCDQASFKEVQNLFAQKEVGVSKTVTLKQPTKRPKNSSLPEQIKVRVMAVGLPNGQLEVLATSLLDEEKYPTGDFAQVYHWRWEIETYYALLKGRLDLEHFSGLSLESVRQDVYATVYLSNLETVLTQPAQAELAVRTQEHKYRQQVNHAVCFHALKSRVIELLLSNQPVQEVTEEIRLLFLQNPQPIRPNRAVSRPPPSAWRSYQFQRNTRKSVF